MTTRKTAQDPLDNAEMKELLHFAAREQLAAWDSPMCLRGERIQRLLLEVQQLRARVAGQDAELAKLRSFRDQMKDAPKRLREKLAHLAGWAEGWRFTETAEVLDRVAASKDIHDAIFGEGGVP